MKKNILLLVGRSVCRESGQIIALTALIFAVLLGLTGLVVDTGHLYYSYQALQASTNASAMAAANGLASSYATAQYNAAEYSSATTSEASQYGYTGTVMNKNPELNVTALTITPGCIGSSVPAAASITCVPIANGKSTGYANAIQVSQTIKVKTYFAAFLGVPYVTLTAKASALMRGSPAAYNIALILDTTGSMTITDENCIINGTEQTRLACAFNGIQTFLTDIAPCGFGGCQGSSNNTSDYSNAFDRVALFAFPNGQTKAIPNDYGCNSLPQDELNPTKALTGSGSFYLNGVPYVFPAIGGPVGTTAYYYTTTTTTGKWPNQKTTTTTTTYNVTSQATYGLGDANGFMSNYQSGSNNLNTQSDLVMTTGGGSDDCPSMVAPYIDGTYYASTIYEAQSALQAESTEYPGTQNVMIIVGDGDSNVGTTYLDTDKFNSMVTTASQTNGLVPTANPSSANNYYPSWNNDCGQAILAAAYAKDQGTTVYTVAYGSPTSNVTSGSQSSYNPGGCDTDTTGIPLGTDNVDNKSTGLSGTSKDISPCQTLKDMASSDSTFFSDFHQSGSDTGCQASTTINFQDLASIFNAIANDLQHARLIPNSVFNPST